MNLKYLLEQISIFSVGQNRRCALHNFDPSVLEPFDFLQALVNDRVFHGNDEAKKVPDYMVVKKTSENNDVWIRFVRDPRISSIADILPKSTLYVPRTVWEANLSKKKFEELLNVIKDNLFGPTWLDEHEDKRVMGRMLMPISRATFDAASYDEQVRAFDPTLLPDVEDEEYADNPTMVNMIFNYERDEFLINFFRVEDGKVYVRSALYELLAAKRYLEATGLIGGFVAKYSKEVVNQVIRIDTDPSTLGTANQLKLGEERGTFL